MAFVPRYILILAALILIDYCAGIQIAKNIGSARKRWLILSLIANLSILVFYKYFNFLLANIAPAISHLFPESHLPYINVILPIGLSFHTFQAMSYTIEVYRGNQPPERNLLVYAVYVMFYPQLVAGPIERPKNLLTELSDYKPYNWDNVKEGLVRMLWGFFKKVVIADRLAIEVDYAFSHYHQLPSFSLVVGIIFYSFQIYCDFSGYSDIALGAAKVMGIKLMENFNEPYLSGSISEFWKRWHISLSSWFRDYVYIPLGGKQKGEWRRKLNVMIVFLLSGLWHGANWKFVAWGGLHGLLTTYMPHSQQGRNNSLVAKTVFVIVNFILVALCWVFFRAANINEAIAYLSGIFSFTAGNEMFGLNAIELLLSVVLIITLLFKEHYFGKHVIKKDTVFGVYCMTMLILCYMLGVFGENQFIYFQF